MALDDLDFKCLACGNDHPTVMKEAHKRGDHAYGNSVREYRYFDLSQKAYFIKIINPEVLEKGFEGFLKNSLDRALADLKGEIEENVSKEEFKKIVLSSKSHDLESDYESKIRDFEAFLRHFGDFSIFRSHHGYAIDQACFDSVLNSAEKVEKEKYLVEGEEEKLIKVKMDIKQGSFLKVFNYLSEYFSLHELPNSQNNLVLGFQCF